MTNAIDVHRTSGRSSGAAPAFAPDKTAPQILLDPRAKYRDYLKGQFFAAAQQEGYASATALMLEDALRRRFHQIFSGTQDDPQSVLPLLIELLTDAMVSPVGEGGFGFDSSQIPPQGQSSDQDYLAQLIALTGKSTHELQNRYRVSFERAPNELSSRVDLNIEALQGLMADSFQTPKEPVGVVNLPPSPTFAPIVPFAAIGSAPFFLEYEEWLSTLDTFYGENLYEIRAALPNLDAEFRQTVQIYPDRPFFPGNGFFDDPGELSATKAWLIGLFGLFDTLAQAFDKINEREFGQASPLLDQVDGMLSNSMAEYQKHPKWLRDRFEWSGTGTTVGPTASEQLISLKDRAALPVATKQDLDAFEAYFNAPFLPPFDADHQDDTSKAEREMGLARARSLFIYDLIFLRFAGLPYLRAHIASEQGAYAEAFRWLAPLTGYIVGVSELTETAPYASQTFPTLYNDNSLPYTENVGFDEGRTQYKDHLTDVEAISSNLIESFPLAAFERRHIKLQQGEVMLSWADREHRASAPAIHRARELYKGVLFLHVDDPDLTPAFTFHLPPPTEFGINPAVSSQIVRAKLGFQKIERGLNAYGYADDFVPVLRYRPLKDAADRFAALAKSTENEFIEYIARLEQAEIDEAQAQSMAAKAEASVQIAEDREANAQFEVDRAQEQLAAVKAAIAAREQEIADSDSLFGQVSTFLKKGVGDTLGGLLDSTGIRLHTTQLDFPPKTESDFSDMLKKLVDDTHADQIASGFEFMESFVAFGVVGYTVLSSMADESNRRQSELARLKDHDLPLAQQVVTLKQRDKAIAGLETLIAQADRDFAQWLLKFQRQRFLSRAFWRTMANLVERLMTRYVELGARTAWFAERALAFEQARALHIIRLDYQAPQIRNITGADLLLADLAELEATRLDGIRLTVPVTRTFSLARDFPTAFATLKATGTCTFRTSERDLQAAYPGTFSYRIRTVSANVQSLRTIPLRGLLTNGGFSVLSGNQPDNATALARFPDALPLSDFSLIADAAIFGVPGETLLQFEGLGLDSNWNLSFPAAANRQGLSALADVLLTFNLNAFWSPEATALAPSEPARSGFSLLLAASTFDAAGTLALRAGVKGGKTVTLEFDVPRARLPEPGPLTIANIGAVAVGIEPTSTAVRLTIATASKSAATDLVDGIALSNAGNLTGTKPPSTLNPLVGEPANQRLRVTLSPPAGVNLGPLRDFVLYLELRPSATPAPLDGVWTQIVPDASVFQPEFNRVGHSAVYDQSSNRMIIFGGSQFERFALLNDVEALTSSNGSSDDSKWITLLEPGLEGSPTARAGHSAVYDQSNNRMILFGGQIGIHTFLNDLWVLSDANGVTGTPKWTQLSPGGKGPSPRQNHVAAYSAADNRMIVFGGGSDTEVFSDVWLLSNANGLGGEPQWIRLDPSGTPGPALLEHSGVYDPVANTLTVFGGVTSLTTFQITNAVWRLTGANGLGGPAAWTNVIPDGVGDTVPPPRAGHTGVFDAAKNRMLVFGGGDDSGLGFFGDVWALSQSNGVGGASIWTKLRPAGGPPAARVFHTSFFDSVSRRMNIYGGGSSEGSFFSIWLLGET